MSKKEAILLGVLALLVVSNLAALVLLLRLGEAVESARPVAATPAAAERPSAGTTSAARDPADLVARLGEIDARLKTLDDRLRLLGDRPGASSSGAPAAIAPAAGATGSAGGTPVAVAAAGNPKMERMLQASQDVKKFWEEVAGLAGIRRGIDSAEYVDLLLERTAAFLQLDPEKRRSFDELMKRRAADLEALEKEQRASSARLNQARGDMKPEERKTAMLEYQELNRKFSTRRSQMMEDTRAGLGEFLNDQDFRHKTFLGQLDKWFRSASGSYGGGEWDGW